ncbi:3-deoxy-manno-octulosonate cytidylyltransferase [Nitrosophilus kaiyonis]|uniref:3-deoxy-manno-octulosonate cytidylyltransferase n=1 Tax=Nitrosophilus kaiyonis TaxID=2930200 RepID=UPI0024933F8D|nr:3-deoxy-manno-octulosonate cytidylyltransferase [Nitrosophilus kaiyonis]
MIIIPARLASTRFPEKILEKIDGIPMVIKTAQSVKDIDEIVIATDSKKVAYIVKNYGFEAVLTNKNHKSGTDRINEAAAILGIDKEEIIINVQADEPFIEKEVVEKVYELTKKNRHSEDILMNSAYKIVTKEEANDENLVKVVTDNSDIAIYFSRSLIPFPRDEYFHFKGHLGIYGYTRKNLEKFCKLSPSILEETEKLEQLRALSHGFKVAMVEVKTKSFGIDTPMDLEKALKMFS